MAFSVVPKAGPNWVAVGDAAGAVNPFNGEGIDYGYETARLAAGFIERAVKEDDLGHLEAYAPAIDDEYRLYNKVARVFVNLIGNPAIMKTLVHTGMRSTPLMEWTLRVMANLLEPEHKGIGDRAYDLIERIVAVGPEPRVKAR
jgi:flavin-dependent dehydrogenase